MLGRRYGLTGQEFDAIAPLANDIAEAKLQQALAFQAQQFQGRFDELERVTARNNELIEIANDPVMRHPRVQVEVGRILEENPSIFQFQRSPIRYALDVALRRLATRDYGAQPEPTGGPQAPGTPPALPPRTAGGYPQGAPGSAVPPTPLAVAADYFQQPTSDAKRKILENMGLIRPE